MAITVTQTEIGAPDGGGLELTFEDFVLEDDEGCNFDFVQVKMMVRVVMVMVNYHNGSGEDIDGDFCASKVLGKLEYHSTAKLCRSNLPVLIMIDDDGNTMMTSSAIPGS